MLCAALLTDTQNTPKLSPGHGQIVLFFRPTWKVSGHSQWNILLQNLSKCQQLSNMQWVTICLSAGHVLLTKQQTTFRWKPVISVTQVLQGSAETLIRWDEKLYILSIAYLHAFYETFLSKIIKIQQVYSLNSWRSFMRHKVQLT